MLYLNLYFFENILKYPIAQTKQPIINHIDPKAKKIYR